jgi:hypothetical protein
LRAASTYADLATFTSGATGGDHNIARRGPTASSDIDGTTRTRRTLPADQIQGTADRSCTSSQDDPPTIATR